MSVTVPGALAGWDMLAAHVRHDARSRRRCSRRSRYARDGFPGLADHRRALGGRDGVPRSTTPAAAATFLPGGHAPKAGEWFRNPDYARTLREIADNGIGTFYGGALGQRIVARLTALGGFITLDDLQEECADLGDADLGAVPRLSRVGAAAEQPGHRRARDAAHPRAVRPQGDGAQLGAVPASSHRGEEARLRRSRPVRRRRGPSRHARRARCSPTSSSPSGAAISTRRSAQERVDPGPLRTQSETIYLTAADNEGNMVSFINSNFDDFGSGIVVPGTGLRAAQPRRGVHADAGSAEHRRAGQASVPHADSRLRHRARSDGREQAVHELRAHGRRRCRRRDTCSSCSTISSSAWTCRPPSTRRGSAIYDGQRVALEAPIGDAVRAALTAMGHVLIDQPPGAFGGAQAIVRLPKGFAAGSDPRKDGMAVGY